MQTATDKQKQRVSHNDTAVAARDLWQREGCQNRRMKFSTNIESKPHIELRRDEVARKTVQLWKAAGRPKGRDLEFWLQAEVELASEHLHYR